nr:hypothetical protein GCM10020063_008780 [Dactylosporangium thailandense]
MVHQADDYTAGAFHYQSASKTTYDPVGRVKTITDANGNLASTDYTTNAVGLVVSTTATNPLLQTSATTFATRIPDGQPHIHVNDQPWADPGMAFEHEILIEGTISGVPREISR